jgi:hypothetical protein
MKHWQSRIYTPDEAFELFLERLQDPRKQTLGISPIFFLLVILTEMRNGINQTFQLEMLLRLCKSYVHFRKIMEYLNSDLEESIQRVRSLAETTKVNTNPQSQEIFGLMIKNLA